MDELDSTAGPGSLGEGGRSVAASAALATTDKGFIRVAFAVRGQVQGVGFRPFVYRLANRYRLSGWVRNHPGGVDLEVQGSPDAVSRFRRSLLKAPAPAVVGEVKEASKEVLDRESGFEIRASRERGCGDAVTPDIAVCEDCLRELFDPGNRRYRYAFVNCTHCGPRYSITRTLPYDRCNTSMAPFAMCNACAAEYSDPENRRFHAQPNACASCGPRLDYRSDSSAVGDADPIAWAWEAIRRGRIVAAKGLGGFHLVCDAGNAEAVERLRRRKGRPTKPFAIMVPGLAALERVARSGSDAVDLLHSPESPIVLVEKSTEGDQFAPGVAPGLLEVGVMLPYTPLHYLLFHEANGRPAGTAWLDAAEGPVLVVTSGNRHGEPLLTGNDEAFAGLAGIADDFLLHDREIVVRCDDSVRHAGEPRGGFIRRARGYAPSGIRLPTEGPGVLAVGAGLKNTLCLTGGNRAVVSQHLGDLENRAARVGFESAAAHLRRLLDIEPQWVARDLHPEFHSSRFAERLSGEAGLPCVAVQHHHAHIASVMAEHGLIGPVLGVAFDGFGMGADGQPWGGELLRVDASGFKRLGHLRALPMPGGDAAAREPWRMGAAALYMAHGAEAIPRRFPGPAANAVGEMLERGVRVPLTTSAGRLFDAAAALLGVCDVNTFESEAAMRLEALAAQWPKPAQRVDDYAVDAENTLDLLPLLATLGTGSRAAEGAAAFQATLAAGVADWVLRTVSSEGISKVALGGGCFLNRTLVRALRGRLEAEGVSVYEARRLPPNDGGLSLGQAWVVIMQTLYEA